MENIFTHDRIITKEEFRELCETALKKNNIEHTIDFLADNPEKWCVDTLQAFEDFENSLMCDISIDGKWFRQATCKAILCAYTSLITGKTFEVCRQDIRQRINNEAMNEVNTLIEQASKTYIEYKTIDDVYHGFTQQKLLDYLQDFKAAKEVLDERRKEANCKLKEMLEVK